MADFSVPDFLQNQSTDEIHQRMLDHLPDDIDKTEGGFAYDFTRPTAIEKAEMVGYSLQETIKIMFPQWSYGEWLDLHAASRGLERKAATAATGTITVTGTAGTRIPAGTVFQTSATTESSSIQFKTQNDATIANDGTVSIDITALTAGTVGNVAAGAIDLLAQPITGVTTIKNVQAIVGGTQSETDENLRQRILECDSTQGLSYVGSISDYKRWAMEVDGVGSVTVVPPADDSGQISLIIRDSTGEPANAALLKAINDHIMSPDDPQKRLAPINALVSVVAPTLVSITVAATLVISKDTTLPDVKAAFTANLQSYYSKAISEGAVKYGALGALLMNTSGVCDYNNLTLNGGTANVLIASDQTPSTAGVTLSV